jgi:hypothetical protein
MRGQPPSTGAGCVAVFDAVGEGAAAGFAVGVAAGFGGGGAAGFDGAVC